MDVAAVGRPPEALGEPAGSLGEAVLGRDSLVCVVPEKPELHGALRAARKRADQTISIRLELTF
jgi:hypothetical protein